MTVSAVRALVLKMQSITLLSLGNTGVVIWCWFYFPLCLNTAKQASPHCILQRASLTYKSSLQLSTARIGCQILIVHKHTTMRIDSKNCLLRNWRKSIHFTYSLTNDWSWVLIDLWAWSKSICKRRRENDSCTRQSLHICIYIKKKTTRAVCLKMMMHLQSFSYRWNWWN